MNRKLLLQYTGPTPDEIAACAYSIWENEGRPPGREIAHWFQAEAQLIATRKHDAGLIKEPGAKKAVLAQLHRQAA